MPSDRLIDITTDQLYTLIRQAVAKEVETLNNRLQKLENAFVLQAPSFDVPTAARYANKSESWVRNAINKHHLPLTKVGMGNRITRAHLDHFLQGGTFSAEGKMIENKSMKLIKNSE